MTTLLLLLFLSGVPDAAQFVGTPKGAPVSGHELATRTDQVASLLRCPVCQGMSVADSHAAMAINMKQQVRELLARGYTEEQILDYFERSYGQFVLLRPKFNGVTSLVWMLPIVALLIGVGIVFWKLKAMSVAREAKVAKAIAPAVAVDDPYLAQVRQLVDGERK